MPVKTIVICGWSGGVDEDPRIGHQLFGVRRPGLFKRGGDCQHGVVPDDGADPRIIIVFILIRLEERIVLGILDVVPRVAGDDPVLRRFSLQRVDEWPGGGLARISHDDTPTALGDRPAR